MIIHKSYKFRLFPTEEQNAMLLQHGGNVRFVWNKLWNFALDYKKENLKFPNQSQLQKQIIILKQEYDFLKIGHSQPIQVKAQRLVSAIKKAYSKEIVSKRNRKISEAKKNKDPIKMEKKLKFAMNFGFPKFKSKHRQRDSLFYPQNFKIEKKHIKFAKIGSIKLKKHRKIEGKPKFATIVQEGQLWFVAISSEVNIKELFKKPVDQANIVGIDVGLTTFATLSDNSFIKNPRTLKKHLKRLKRESRKLSRKENKETEKKSISGKLIKKSSNNRMKQVAKVQKVHRKVKNIRKNFLHVTTHQMINKYDGFVLENLSIQEMLVHSSKSMNRSISDVSWFEFGRILEYKSFWFAKHFCKIDRFFPSTQMCHDCGSLTKLSLSDREYLCPACGSKRDRDFNASLNIRDEGLRIIKQNTTATVGIKACGPVPERCWDEARKIVLKQNPVSEQETAHEPSFA